MTFEGILIAESMRTDADVDLASVRVRRVRRADAGDESAGQSRFWTLIEFEVGEEHVEGFIRQLEKALEPGPWYCDMRSDEEIAVVFSGRAFRYRRGDRLAHSEARDYARSVGTPDPQIDWPA